MATYDGVHTMESTVGGVVYARLWWYTGRGSERKTESIGARDKLTKADIVRARKDKEAELAKRPEMIRAGEAPTLAGWWSEYVCLRPDANERTMAELKGTMDLMREFWGDTCRVDKIDRKEVGKWRAWLTTRIAGKTGGAPAPATIARHIRHGSGLFGVHSGAAKFYPSVRNPFEGEKMNAATETKGHPQLSMEDLAALIAAAPAHEGRCIIALCAYAGLRQGEALRLQWGDVQWEKNRLIATATKNTGADKGKQREVLMVPELARVLLAAHEADLASPCMDMTTEAAYRQIEAAWAASGVEEWAEPFQALRRWRDTTWKGEGRPEYAVDAWLGHSMAVSRKNYLKPPDAMYASEVAKSGRAAILSALTEQEVDQVKRFVEDLMKLRKNGASKKIETP